MKNTCAFGFVFSAVWLASICAGAQEFNINGLITQRSADVLMVRSAEGERNIVLTDMTKIKSKGFRVRKAQILWAELIPGLRVCVNAVTGEDRKITARTINFNKQDLQAISLKQAALEQTEAKIVGTQEG